LIDVISNERSGIGTKKDFTAEAPRTQRIMIILFFAERAKNKTQASG
jgi:hypothetical protein